MDEKLQSVMDWFEAHTNQTISIRKEEQGDSDEVQLHLAKVGYWEPKTDDDYMDDPSFVLYGGGTVVTDESTVSLPQDVFVIPVAGLSDVNAGGNSLVLKTERANYRIGELQLSALPE